jgi:penicillin-binding protein 1A
MQQLREEKTMLQAGFMALEPTTGQIKAWVGSRGFEEDQFDHVAQARRQPGSTFKPFVYGAAFEQGMKPGDTLLDGVVEIQVDNGKVWRPSDGGAPSGLDMTLRDGLAFSKNTITAQLTQRVGAPAVANLARAMGVRQSKLNEVLSLGLGTSPVTLKEMVTAYGTLANGGAYIEPMVITRIDDRWGKPLEFFTAKASEPAMSVQGAQTLVDVMRGVIDRGTGAGIRSRFGIQADVAGKTGTTQDNTDAWFILMHPQLVAGAWVGFNDNRVTMGSDWGQGARSALPIVGDFFQHSLKAKVIDASMRFPTPPREPDPVPAPMPEMVVEPVEVMPPGVAMPVDAAPPPQAVTTETVPVVGGSARVDRVERPTFGLPVFPPLPRDAVPAATIQQQAPAATILGPAAGPADRPAITIPVPPSISAPALPGPQTVDPMAANRAAAGPPAAAVASPVPTPYIVESRPPSQ